MGPPKFIGGNMLVPGVGAASIASFNGAAEIHRRKWKFLAAKKIGRSSLQWGRRNSSAEIPQYLTVNKP